MVNIFPFTDGRACGIYYFSFCPLGQKHGPNRERRLANSCFIVVCVCCFIYPLYPIIQPCSFCFLSSTTAVLLVRSLFFVVVVSFRSRKEDNWSNPPTWMIMTRFTSLSKQPKSDRFFENLPPLFLASFLPWQMPCACTDYAKRRYVTPLGSHCPSSVGRPLVIFFLLTRSPIFPPP